jgi:molybdate transport repressor ModE-like protein
VVSLDQLRVLRAIAQNGSLGSAARALGLSQPTLSHHLAALEAIIGGRLVERSPRGSQLTELGELALVHAEAILDRADSAERELRDHARHGAAVVQAGSFPSAGAVLMVPSLARVGEGEGAEYHLTVAESPELAEGLCDGRLHVALLMSEPDIPIQLGDDIASEPVLDDPLLVLLPPGHPAAAEDVVPLAALAGEKWISGVSDDDPPHGAILRAHLELGREARIGVRVDDYAVTEALVAAGMGVSLMPTIALDQLSGTVVARPLDDPRFARRIHIAWQTRPRRPAVERLVDAIRAVAAAQGS